MVEIIKHEPEKVATELVSILRWEEDGGKTMETHHLRLDPPLVQTVPVYGALPATPLRWNQQFVIEPFQADAGIRLIKRRAPMKK